MGELEKTKDILKSIIEIAGHFKGQYDTLLATSQTDLKAVHEKREALKSSTTPDGKEKLGQEKAQEKAKEKTQEKAQEIAQEKAGRRADNKAEEGKADRKQNPLHWKIPHRQVNVWLKYFTT